MDEMIERVMQKGFIDGKGDKYYPTILRLGMSRCVSHTIYFKEYLQLMLCPVYTYFHVCTCLNLCHFLHYNELIYVCMCVWCAGGRG